MPSFFTASRIRYLGARLDAGDSRVLLDDDMPKARSEPTGMT
jgi:hypothetical protein